MPVKLAYLSTIFFMSFVPPISVGLTCYQCSASTSHSPCEEDIRVLLRGDQHLGKATKNCSIEHDQTLCMIQVVKSRGEVSSFIRDCTDGVTFGFEEIKRLHNLLPTNQTTCATYGTSGLVVCMSVCKNDYCNGPQLANNGVEMWLRHYVLYIILVVCAIVEYNKMLLY